MNEPTKLYRYNKWTTSSGDEDSGTQFYHHQLNLDEYEITKYTPAGYRLDNGKFVNKYLRKKYAYPTPEEAMVNFIERSKKHIKILKASLGEAVIYLNVAEQLQKNNNHEQQQ